MRALSLLLCFFSILGCLLAANVTSVSQPAAGKAYYKVFPKDDIDITKTSDFIKGVVGAEDLLPWTDVKDKLMHWTVEASMEEVEVLKGDEGVARVEVFVPPTAPVSARSAEDSSPEDDEAAKSYLITPTDGRFPRAVEETRQSLENLVGKDKVHQYGGQSGSAIWWYCNLTISQKNDAVKISGVKNIYEETGDEAQQLPGSHRTRDIALSLKRDESLEIYLVFPGKKGSTEEETVEAVKFLQELVGEENVSRPLLSGNAVVFWQCNLTPTQGDEASKHPGIRAVERSPKMEKFLRIPARDTSSLPSVVAKARPSQVKRALSYSTQVRAVNELIAISQPSTIPDVTHLSNYVYDSKCGSDSFVYHLESGVAYKDQASEFPNVVPDNEHIQTSSAKAIPNLHPWIDTDQLSHSTCTAGKAVGKNFGASKNAKLVVVQLGSEVFSDFFEALGLIIEDIKSKPERKKKSVVSVSFGFRHVLADHGQQAVDALQERLQKLFDVDVPLFAASGNDAIKRNKIDIDSHPALLATPEFPLITVGSAEFDGLPSGLTQRGPHLTLYAVGSDATCMGKTGNSPLTGKAGTSLAAPLIAGIVANFLSYDTVPFDTSDGNLVKNLRDYLQSDQGSWARLDGTDVVWNGVTEADNPEFGLPPPVPPPPGPAPTAPLPPPPGPPPTTGLPPPPGATSAPVKTCNGVATNKYVSRDSLLKNVQSDFCPEVVKQGGNDPGSGSIGRVYNPDTIEQVSIYLDLPPGTPVPTKEECEAHFMDLIDNCDGNDANNPMNYKAGGLVTVGTNKYHITPEKPRQPASAGVKGDCDSTYKVYFNDYVVWGHGWDSADNGETLKQQVKGCALLPDTWSFAYGLGDDGREWTAKFRTGVFQKKCVGHAGKTASGMEDFGCSGSG